MHSTKVDPPYSRNQVDLSPTAVGTGLTVCTVVAFVPQVSFLKLGGGTEQRLNGGSFLVECSHDAAMLDCC